MKARLIFSAVALAIAGWCYATDYTLTLYADGCESANIIRCEEVGLKVHVGAIPNNHHHFVCWTDGDTSNPRWITLTQDTTLTAVFATNQYTITASGEHGIVEGTGTYEYDPNNTKVYLTAIPDKGYYFVKWRRDGTYYYGNPLEVSVDQNLTFTAVFAPYYYTITASGEHGIVKGRGMYEYNAVVYLTAVPDKGYHFVKWSDGNTDNPRSVMVECDTTYTAEFAPNQYTITTYAQHGNVSGGGTYDYGTTATLTATADAHYHFTQWNDGDTDNPRTVSIEDDATYTAEFAIDQYTITASGEYGTVEGTGTYDYNTKVYLTAVPDKGYHFVKWSNGMKYNPYYVYVRSDTTLTAEFAPNQYTITTTYAQHGNVSGGGTYDYGTTATLTATANEHYHFTQWSDGNTDNPRTISVEGDATYTAEFKPNPYIITVSAGEHGNVSGAGTYDYGTTATLTATADEHYHFTQWTDGNTDNPRTVSVVGDATYIAEFKPNSYTITVYAGEYGNVNGAGTYDYGTTATLTAIADEHYHFTQWTDGNTDNPRTITVEGDAAYTAEFLLNEYTITVLYDNTKGYVSGGGTYVYGTQVRLEVTANSGYQFSQWSNGATYNPYLLTAIEDLTLEAQFIPATAVDNVSADGTTPQKIVRDGQVYILRNGKTYTTTGVEVK